jgi:hypothetical protein
MIAVEILEDLTVTVVVIAEAAAVVETLTAVAVVVALEGKVAAARVEDDNVRRRGQTIFKKQFFQYLV